MICTRIFGIYFLMSLFEMTSTAPVVIWGDVGVPPKRPLLTTVKAYDFIELLRPLMKKAPLVVFVENDLTPRDYLCWNRQTKKPCYEFLKSVKPIAYYANVEYPREILQLIVRRPNKSYRDAALNGSLSKAIVCKPGSVNEIHFADTKYGRDRSHMLSSHDMIIGQVTRNLKCNATYLYLPKAIDKSRSIRSQEPDDGQPPGDDTGGAEGGGGAEGDGAEGAEGNGAGESVVEGSGAEGSGGGGGDRGAFPELDKLSELLNKLLQGEGDDKDKSSVSKLLASMLSKKTDALSGLLGQLFGSEETSTSDQSGAGNVDVGALIDLIGSMMGGDSSDEGNADIDELITKMAGLMNVTLPEGGVGIERLAYLATAVGVTSMTVPVTPGSKGDFQNFPEDFECRGPDVLWISVALPVRSSDIEGSLFVGGKFAMYFRDLKCVNDTSVLFKSGNATYLVAAALPDKVCVTLRISDDKTVNFNVQLVNGYHVMPNISCANATYLVKDLVYPPGLAYSCSSFEAVDIEEPINKLRFSRFQFQIATGVNYVDIKKFNFGESWDCVGFVTTGIASGLFTVFLMIAIAGCGVSWMMSIETCDRFEDPLSDTPFVNNATD